LPDDVISLLKQLKKKQEDLSIELGDVWEHTGRLFTSQTGTPLCPDTPRKYLMRFCKKYGFRFISLHGFRHFHASLLISQGLDVKTVQKMLGHSSANTTLGIYAHSFRTAEDIASDVVTGAISLGGNPSVGEDKSLV
jgi:integrase